MSDLYFHPQARALAEAVAGAWRLHCRDAPPQEHVGFYLWAVDDHLELRRGGERGAVWVDAAELRRRAGQAGELRRACIGRGSSPTVLDAMAGWGVDALVLAAAGARVDLVERHPALCALAQDLVRRHGAGRASCRCGDGFDALAGTATWDVVYLDPMFPLRGKRALPGKRMQWTAQLTTPDPRTPDDWLDAAVRRARDRVVLKRRRTDPPVRPADWRIVGSSVRYDVYRGRGG